jgi:hypothetical protein
LIRGNKTFEAEISGDGIIVDNLGNQPYLPWNVFVEAVSILKENGGQAKKGNAMNSKLGERGLPIDSIEGHIAYKVYGYKEGDSVFRRITPIACILIWANICKHKPGKLILSNNLSNLLNEPDTEKAQEKSPEKASISQSLDKGEMEIYNCLRGDFSGEADYTQIAYKLNIGFNLALNRLKKLESKGFVNETDNKWKIIEKLS